MRHLILAALIALPGLLAAYSPCEDCHDTAKSVLDRTMHRSLECTACHGDGKSHMDDPSVSNAPRPDSSLCVRCHADKPAASATALPDHSRAGTVCLDCHALTHGKGVKPLVSLLKRKGSELCLTCHGEMKAALHRPYTHRTACYECHQPHGRDRDISAMCGSCHRKESAPHVYEHLPVGIGSCLSCHENHGSANPRMLTRPDVRLLCLECHPDTSSFHDMRIEAFRNCLLCHDETHGSDRNLKLFR